MADDDYVYRLLFKLKVHQASGDGFQQLFNALMTAAHDAFEPVAPWGNVGDGGNDGWVPTVRHYFQLYGPKASSEWKPGAAAKKARDDFGKLRESWPQLEAYSFVLNDRYDGVPAPVGQAVAAIGEEHDVKTASVGAHRLEQWFSKLPPDDKDAIVGGRPVGPVLDELDPSKVGEVLQRLADQPLKKASLGLQAPDFYAKVALNGLAPSVADELRYASYHVGTVDELLDTRPGLAQEVASEIRGWYERSGEVIPAGHDDSASVRYLWMKEQLIPPAARKHPHSYKAYDFAAQVVMAKYFESCDIYEHPDGITA